jgi:hypothetical protein
MRMNERPAVQFAQEVMEASDRQAVRFAAAADRLLLRLESRRSVQRSQSPGIRSMGPPDG